MPPSNPWACQRSDQAPRVEKPWSPRPKCTSAAQSDSGIIHTSMIEVPMPNHISMRKWWTLGIIGHHCVMFQDYAQFALFPASMVIADNTRKRLSWSLGWVSSHCLRSSIALRLRQVAVTFLLIILISFESWNTVEFLPGLAQSIEPAAANVPPAIHLHWLHWQHGKHSPAGAMPPQESPAARNDWLMASTPGKMFAIL